MSDHSLRRWMTRTASAFVAGAWLPRQRWSEGRRAASPLLWLGVALGGAVFAMPLFAPDDGSGGQGPKDDTETTKSAGDPLKNAAWSKIEQDEKRYKEALKSGGAFDAAAKDFVTKKVIPQLASDANRPMIDQRRRRMRDMLLLGIDNDGAYEAAAEAVAESALALARDDESPAVARVNAMLLIGEMRTKDGREGTVWAPAAVPLSAAAGDKGLAPAVRVAAVAGLVRHADVARRAGGEKLTDFAKAARSSLLGIAAEPVSEEDPVAGEWLASRALSLLPSVMKSAPKEVAANLVGVINDQARSIDVRIRAAAALGATVTAKSEIDAVAAVGSVVALAIAALEADDNVIRDRRYEQLLNGGGGASPSGPRTQMPGMGMPGMGGPGMMGGAGRGVAETSVSDQACRRTAWRLVTLADGLLTEDEKAGLATLLSGEDRDNSKAYAVLLREQGLAIDEARTEASISEALALLRPGDESAAGAPAEGEGATESETTEPGSPFGN